MIEVWKDIDGYKGSYQISNLGAVKSVDRYVNSKNGSLKPVKGQIIKSRTNRYGYVQVNLYKNQRMGTYLVHRLVAQAFLSNPDNLPQVNHEDEDKANNFVWVNEDGSVDPQKSNLEWCNAEYNANYGTKWDRYRKNRKGKNNNSKSSKRIAQIKDGVIIDYFPSEMEVQRAGIAKAVNVSKCCNHRKYYNTAGGGYQWEFVD